MLRFSRDCSPPGSFPSSVKNQNKTSVQCVGNKAAKSFFHFDKLPPNIKHQYWQSHILTNCISCYKMPFSPNSLPLIHVQVQLTCRFQTNILKLYLSTKNLWNYDESIVIYHRFKIAQTFKSRIIHFVKLLPNVKKQLINHPSQLYM